MARKRLNKKVALIGSLVFVFLALAVILLFLYWGRDPEPFIRDGDAAMKAADEATDEQIKEEEYERAERSYHKARSLEKTDSRKVEMLFKLVDLYIKTDQWRNVHGCWNQIIQLEPKNAKARFARLKYFYIMADNSPRGYYWTEIESQASEFIEVAEDAGILAEDTAQFESFGVQETEAKGKRLGVYLYLLRGRALLEITKLGAVTDRDESIARAIDDLEKVQELAPEDPQVYWYLAQAVITKGEIIASRGNFQERDKTREQAKELLEQAVELAGADNARAQINLLVMKPLFAQMTSREQVRSLEPEYLSLVEKFDSSAQAYSALARFYLRLGHKNLDKSIEAFEKAIELDKENVVYAINAVNLHYRKFSIYGQNPELYKAIEVASKALTLPNAQEIGGPRQMANRNNRVLLYIFLANCYIEQVLEPCEQRSESESGEWLTKAEQAVHEIEQFYGSGEEPQVVKWQGMLELAKFQLGKGDRNTAIKKLYGAYEQLKASGRRDARLSYTLAKFFENTVELGAAREFFISALSIPNRNVVDKIDETKPEALLDFAEVLLKLRDYDGALNIISFFENEYWTNQRSWMLRIKLYIATNQFDEAEEELAHARPDDPNTIKLDLVLVQAKVRQVRRAIAQKQTQESLGIILQRDSGVEEETVEQDLERDKEHLAAQAQTAELKGYLNALAELVEKLLLIEPNSVDTATIVAVCDDYLVEGKTDKAKDLINRFLQYFPDDERALFYKQILSERELGGEISEQRRKEIEEEILSNIADPVRRAMNFGLFYGRNKQPKKAAEEFKKVLNSRLRGSDDAAPLKAGDGELTDLERLAAHYLLETVFETEDWELAEQVTETARDENIDGCEGNFFAARLAMAKGEYKDALARLKQCLGQRPVFSHGFALGSNINAALGNEHASVEDIRKASSLNPLDGGITKLLATVLYERNKKLGDNATSDQIIETRAALDRALVLNPGDLELLSGYAEYISATEPLRALAIRQNLQKIAPSMRNAVLLGKLAMKMAVEQTDAERKEALFAIAASSFEQARTADPHDRTVLYNYAEYYRTRGQDEKARQLLLESQDQEMLWTHYFRTGQFEDAKRILEQLYHSESKNNDVVKGLLLVAEKTADKEAVKKYSEELLLLEDTVKNRLFQIQTFLRIGLIKETEYKLQSFKEKYPDNTGALLFEAWLALAQGQLKKAMELTNQSLESNQDSAVAWQVRGEINRLMANYDQAIIDLNRSRSLSADPSTRIALAKAYRGAGREEDAITELKSTIDHPQAPRQARELLEQSYWRLGKKDALKRFYDETLEKFPDSVYWHNRAGTFAMAIGDFSSAEQFYGRAWQKSRQTGNGNIRALDGYLQALVSGGKLDKVFEEGGKYVDGDFAPVAFFRMAAAKQKLGDKASVIEYCRKAVDKAGANEAFVSNILEGMYSLLGAEEVLKYCEERLEANPDSLAANFTMFNLAMVNSEYNKAVRYIDKCVQIAEPNSQAEIDYIVKKVQVLTLAYNKTSNKNYLNSAIAEYESLLAKVPNNTMVLNNLAYMLAENNVRLDEALKYVKRACQAKPNDPRFLDTYSWVLYKSGRFVEAAEFLQSALQQYELNKTSAPADVYEHLGMIKEELGSVAEALAAYKQALEIGAEQLSEPAIERIKRAVERLSQQGQN